eukprot:CAMPEP_0196599450 /NCGR_PEP_ID=MMETSP1081-20130531/94863_1 /TAXON_ID=36882 /ORGANISM="Pyramimonas amylifera, Strain CCMP720" /LENGTH=2090 /DNA_ID=CAMNT_0041925221 /DNA_START=417 /DNA_END=6689 /DNA_ORIENTATION=+
MTIGWVNGGFYYTDDVKAEPVLSVATVDRKAWHYIVLTLEAVDRDVYFDVDGLLPAHRNGTLYVDGMSVLTFESRLPDLNEAIITVGKEYKQYESRRFFTGLVDELRIYNDTLSEEELQTVTFTKPGNAAEATAAKLVFYTDFNDIDKNDIRDSVINVNDMASKTKTKVYYCDKVQVTVMPYDPIAISTISQDNPFQDALYSPLNLTGPMKGAVLTIMGVNFANTPFLTVFVDGQKGTYEYIDTSTLIIDLPTKSISIGETSQDFIVDVVNGGLPGGNSASFPITYMYVLGQDWADNLVVFYKWDGDLINAASRADRHFDGTIPSSYGNGGPFFADNRQGHPKQALQFVRGERVETPVLLGHRNMWSVCAWVYAERSARTLYYERDHSKQNVANLIQLDADGVIHLDGEPGAPLKFDAWQFVCITKSPESVDFYTGGQWRASAEPVEVSQSMARGLIGTNWTGVVDDFWVADRVLSTYDVMSMYSNEEFAIELDGSEGHFVITNTDEDAVEFDSTAWRGSSVTAFSVEAYVMPYTINGTQPIFYQPSMTPTAATEAATSQGYDGVYISILNGKVVFYTLVDSDSGSGVLFQLTETQNVVVTTNEWNLIAVTFDSTTATISVNGVPQLVTAGNTVCNTTNPLYCDKNTFTSSTLEASTMPVYVGYGKQHSVYSGTFQGLVGEVRMWSKALTTAEINSDCPPIPGSTSGLYAYFKLDDAAGSLYYSGHSPNLQMVFSGPKTPYWVPSNYTVNEFFDTDATYFPNSVVAGEGSYYGDIEATNTFTFQARDGCARLRKFESIPMQLVVGGPLHTHEMMWEASILPNGDGTYTGSYNATQCGFYALRVESTDVPLPDTTNGEAFIVFSGAYDQYMAKGSPFKTYLEPGPMVASMSYAYDAPDLLSNNDLKVAYYGAPAAFTLQTVDKYGCKRTKGGDSLDVFLTGRYNVEGEYMDHKDGTYTISYVPMIQGLTQLHVLHKGMPVGTNGEEDPKDSCGVSMGTDYAGSPWLIDVQQGSGSLMFSGPSCVELPSEDHLNLPGYEFTMEAWVYPMAPYSDGRIISKESPFSGHGFWMGIQDMNVTAGLYVGGEEYRTAMTEEKVTPEDWNHIAVTYDGNKLKIYLNGRQVAREEYDDKKDLKENSQKVKIGLGFHGLIDEVRLMPFTKGSAQVVAGHRCPMSNDTVSMYMMMNDGSGSTVYDYSSYSTHGMFCKGSSPPEWKAWNAPYAVNQIDYELSDIEGEGLEGSRVGITSSFRMDLRDGCGFDYVVIDEMHVNVGLDNTTLFTTSHGQATCPEVTLAELGELEVIHEPSIVGAGPVLVTYMPEKCGNALIDIKVDGKAPEEAPFEVYVIPSESTASQTSILSDLSDAVVAGLETSFTITAHDKFGCKRSTGGDTFQVLMTRTSVGEVGFMRGPDTVAASIVPTDHMDGTYTVYFTAPAVGNYTIDVGYDSGMGDGILSIQGSPYMFYVSMAPWRNFLISGSIPEERYNPTTAVFKDDMYLLRGWGSDKSAKTDVWKYPLASKKDTWTYRRLVSIENVEDKHEIKIIVDTAALINAGKMRADCGDVLFLKTDGDANDKPIGYFIDQHPGCNSAATGFWLKSIETGSIHMYMYYGNVRAESSAVDGSQIFTEFEDFENSSPFRHGWTLAQTCSLPPGDETAFTNDDFVSVTGKKSLRVDAMMKQGGSLVKELKTMETYVLKGFLYDSDAVSSSHWFSPNFQDCVDLPNDKLQLPTTAGLGVFTCTTEDNMAMLYPWSSAGFERSCGWRAVELVCDGAYIHYYIDANWVGTRAAVPLTKIFIRGGAPSKAEDQMFESIAAWDTIYVAAYNPEVTVNVAEEEPVMFTNKGWSAVSTKGTAPPSRNTESSIIYGDKLYMVGGFGTSPEDKLVWHFDFAKSRWGSTEPWGSARLPTRKDHSMVLHGDTVYAFGGRSGAVVFSDMWAYDIGDNAWSTVDAGNGPSPVFSHSAAVYKDTMYVFGGFSEGAASKETWGFNFVMGKWMDLTPVHSPSARFSHTLAVEDDSMFLYGGATMTTTLEDTWKYDFDYNIWTEIKSSSNLGDKSQRSELGLEVYDNKMFVFGGHGSSSYYQDMWSLAVY